MVTFSRDEKVMRERLEENTSERLRLGTVVEYNGERKRLFLIHSPAFAGEPEPAPLTARNATYRHKKKTPTFVDISLALQVGLEPTTP